MERPNSQTSARPLLGLSVLAASLAVGVTGAVAQTGECTGTKSDTKLYVNVENVKSSEGLIAVTLYADNSKKFLAKKGSLYVGRVPAKAGTTRVCIHVPKPGTYGLAVYHDKDANRKFNRNGVGLPAEPYGFSNNASTFLGLPSFKSVRMSVPKDGFETSVKLKGP